MAEKGEALAQAEQGERHLLSRGVKPKPRRSEWVSLQMNALAYHIWSNPLHKGIPLGQYQLGKASKTSLAKRWELIIFARQLPKGFSKPSSCLASSMRHGSSEQNVKKRLEKRTRMCKGDGFFLENMFGIRPEVGPLPKTHVVQLFEIKDNHFLFGRPDRSCESFDLHVRILRKEHSLRQQGEDPYEYCWMIKLK